MDEETVKIKSEDDLKEKKIHFETEKAQLFRIKPELRMLSDSIEKCKNDIDLKLRNLNSSNFFNHFDESKFILQELCESLNMIIYSRVFSIQNERKEFIKKLFIDKIEKMTKEKLPDESSIELKTFVTKSWLEGIIEILERLDNYFKELLKTYQLDYSAYSRYLR